MKRSKKEEYMKTIIKIFLALFLSMDFISLNAQNPDVINLQKYWMARHRQKQHYLVVGDKAGHSIPAGFYNKKDSMSHYGDGTIRLGWYISILATEFKLLELYGQDVTSTAEELYYALKAIERLDSVSGIMWSHYNFPNGVLPKDIEDFGPNLSNFNLLNPAVFDSATYRWVPASTYNPSNDNTKDGFFVRDDVPIYMKHQLTGVKLIASSHAESYAQNNHRYYFANEMSQDQLVFLLMGLKLVDELIPVTCVVKGQSLHIWAKILCGRLMDNVVSSYPRPGGSDKDPYKIVNPHLINANYYHPEVKRGEDMSFYRYPTALVANKIVYSKDFYGFGFSPQQVSGNTYMVSSTNGHTAFLAALNFMSVNAIPIFGINSVKNAQDNKTKEYALVAISNFFKSPTSPNSFHYLYKACVEKQFRSWYVYPLLNHVLFDKYNSYNNKVKSKFHELRGKVEQDLLSYPCEGGYNYGTAEFVYNWGQVNKFFIYGSHLNNPQFNDAFNYFNGHGNGEDYMLMYNLYRLAYFNKYPFEDYTNLNNHIWKQHYPYYEGLGWIENLPNPGVHFSPSPIEFRSLVNAVPNNNQETGDVRLKSATSIHLLPSNNNYPGFKVVYGAKFHAKIVDGTDCNWDGYKNFISEEIEIDTTEFTRLPENGEDNFFPLAKNNIHLYPNPAWDKINVENIDSLESMYYDVNLIDIMGKLHYETSVENNSIFTLDISYLKPGMYIVLVRSSDDTYYKATFIKQ